MTKQYTGRFSAALLQRNIEMPAPDETGYELKINPSLNMASPSNVAGYFLEALKKS